MTLFVDKYAMFSTIFSTVFVCMTDILKIYFVFRYILNYNIFIKIKKLIIYAIGLTSFFTIVYLLGGPAVYYPLFFVPAIFLVLYRELRTISPRFIMLFLTVYICICQIDSFFIALLHLIPPHIKTKWFMNICCAVISSLFIWTIAVIHKKFHIEENQKLRFFPIIQLGVLLLIVLLLGAVTSLLAPASDHFLNNLLLLSVSSLSILITSASLFLYSLLVSHIRHKEADKMNRELLDLQNAYYVELQKKNWDIRCFKHNIKNHIICLKYLLENKNLTAAVEYISQMEEQIKQFSPRYHLGNPVVDAILNEKSTFINEKNIDLKTHGTFPHTIKITDYDLCTIFANALENAVEACNEVTGKRFIKIQIGYYNEYLSIIIVNSSVAEKDLKTSKKDKVNHGYGLVNIKKTVEKYNGNLKIEQAHESFKVDIILKYL